ncbi:MAG: hypothetical protein ACE5NG_11900 [bacterium]
MVTHGSNLPRHGTEKALNVAEVGMGVGLRPSGKLGGFATEPWSPCTEVLLYVGF